MAIHFLQLVFIGEGVGGGIFFFPWFHFPAFLTFFPKNISSFQAYSQEYPRYEEIVQ